MSALFDAIHLSAAYATVNPTGKAPVLLVCEHASNRVPTAYSRLGLDDGVLDTHVAVDIGAGMLTRRLAQLIDAPAVLCRYSRLFVDCNRALGDPSCICESSDGLSIPGNFELAEGELAYRAALVHHPFHRAVEQVLDGWRTGRVAHHLVAIHSFTPALARGPVRPWHVGVVWRDPTLALPLLKQLRALPDLVVGDNEPYDGRQTCGYTIARHAEPFGIPALAVEVRQDQLSSAAGIESCARMVAECLESAISSAGAGMPRDAGIVY